MQITRKGLELIKSFEGKFNKAYRDPCGVLTIGYGHTNVDGWKFGSDAYIDDARCEQLLIEDIQRYVNDVNNAVEQGIINFPLDQNNFDALVCFHYNTGSINTLCRNRNAVQVADALLLYTKGVNGIVYEGLKRRRQAERALFLEEGNFGEPISVEISTPTPSPIEINKVLDIQKVCNQYGASIWEDGIWGGQTHEAVSKLPVAGLKYKTPELTKYIQKILNITVDGIFGPETENAVRKYQEEKGLQIDGVVGFDTLTEMILH